MDKKYEIPTDAGANIKKQGEEKLASKIVKFKTKMFESLHVRQKTELDNITQQVTSLIAKNEKLLTLIPKQFEKDHNTNLQVVEKLMQSLTDNETKIQKLNDEKKKLETTHNNEFATLDTQLNAERKRKPVAPPTVSYQDMLEMEPEPEQEQEPEPKPKENARSPIAKEILTTLITLTTRINLDIQALARKERKYINLSEKSGGFLAQLNLLAELNQSSRDVGKIGSAFSELAEEANKHRSDARNIPILKHILFAIDVIGNLFTLLSKGASLTKEALFKPPETESGKKIIKINEHYKKAFNDLRGEGAASPTSIVDNDSVERPKM